MGDGSALGGWILAAAVVTVLAGGVSAVNSGSGGSGGSGGSADSSRSTAAAASRSTNVRATNLRTPTTGGATVRAAPCTRVAVVRSSSGTQYHEFPVSAAGRSLCLLEAGDNGRPVTVLQRALLRCSQRTLRVTGVYDAQTVAAVRRQQAGKVGQMVDGIYGPITAQSVRWPWVESATGKLTGSCAQAGARA